MRRSGTILSLFPVIFLFACGRGSQYSADPAPEAAVHSRIINGTEIDQAEFPWIVKVIAKIEEGQYNGCTGTVIGEKAVITAAHCVEGVQAVYIQTGGQDGPAFQVESIHIAKGYLALPILGVYNDMAVVITGAALGRPALPLISSALPKPGDKVWLAGFGLENADSGAYGTLRVGETEIFKVTYLHLITRFDGKNSNVCFGDSGGPMLQVVRDAAGELVGMGVAGIVSSGTSAKCAVGDWAFFTVIQRYLDGILQLVPEAQLL